MTKQANEAIEINAVPNFVLTLTDPVVEVPLKAVETSGASETLVVGYSRLNREQGKTFYDFITLSRQLQYPYLDSERTDDFIKKATKEALEKMESIPFLRKFLREKRVPTEEEYLRASIQYIKDTHLMIDGKLTLVDTRDFPEGFLDQLVTSYLNHSTFFQILAQGLTASVGSMAEAQSGVVTMESLKN